ncbi:hypothetical protein OPQ81_008143 [Rhizoctonia solani]|nr:hypothetical protein OPQ81_008143 [Rhizoctonia solani]
MEARYSNLSHMPFESTLDRWPKDQMLPETRSKDEGATMAQKNSLIACISPVWTLVVHCILSVGVTVFVLVYVQGRHFNVTQRTPIVQVDGGTRVAPFLPMQSDIVTLLSSLIAILKCALAAWTGLLCWNIALFLMERPGLARRDLKVLINYGILSPGTFSKNWSILIIGTLLLATLAANLSSPILTGSISWVPHNRLVHGLSILPLPLVDSVSTITELPAFYRDDSRVREAYIIASVGGVGIGWGRDTEKGILKRATSAVSTLAINSTIENVTLPYFKVHSIRWIENRDEIPGIRDGATPIDMLNSHFETTPIKAFGYPAGLAVLFPNITTNWSNDPLDSVVTKDTRLLMLYYAFNGSGIHITMTKSLPPSSYRLSYQRFYYAFAWVTFTAGAGRCIEYSCIISSSATIRNNTPIEPEPHQLTSQALSMASVVGVYLATQNSSLPYPWSNVDEYVEAFLVRTYSSAWAQLNKSLRTLTAYANYVPSSPSLLADVDQTRVYIWLAIQLLVTTLSALFLIIHYRSSNYPLVGDTSLMAFDLDTTAIPSEDADSVINRVRKVYKRGGRLVVDDET